jgi:isopentenyl-diphosphate delta-isomerase
MAHGSRILPSENNKLILVDKNDNILGFKTADECHDGDGLLHRAFSVFIFNEKNQVLMQKRSGQKRLWPLYWSNSCCSHPRKSETNEAAARRRLKEELGIAASLKFLFKFRYHVKFGTIGSEHEVCSVYIGKTGDPITANPREIAKWKFVGFSELEKQMAAHPEQFTPWSIVEWQRLRNQHSPDIAMI